ncbi:MAG: type II toxin-antitoxin system VapC family toxin [Chitinophagales bacterium]|nr:type II toxin-antitoxin system VapC family toxin [Chitinophagales bacterium]
MKNVVFDSYALIAHFKKEKGHEIVSEILSAIAVGERFGFLSLINLGEVYYMVHGKHGKSSADQSLHVIHTMPIEIIAPNYEITIVAAKLKANHEMSYADAFAAALTISMKATLITGDKEFKSLEREPNFKMKFI